VIHNQTFSITDSTQIYLFLNNVLRNALDLENLSNLFKASLVRELIFKIQSPHAQTHLVAIAVKATHHIHNNKSSLLSINQDILFLINVLSNDLK
jgi:hypothetical protein